MGQEAAAPDLPPPPPVPPTSRPRGRPKGSKNKSRISLAATAAPVQVPVPVPVPVSMGPVPVAVAPGAPPPSVAAASAPPDESAKAKGRGPSFTPHEGLVLARAWVEQSAKGAYQREDSFWGEVEAYCTANGVKRSRDSLKTQWRRMGRQCQTFINCRALIRSQRVATQTGETFEDAVMNLYRHRMGRTDGNGIYQYATPFKFVEAAEYLQQQPKFVENYMKDPAEDAALKQLAAGGQDVAGTIVPGVDDDDAAQAAGDGQDKDGEDGERRDDDGMAGQVGGRVSDAQPKTPEVIVVQDRERLKARPIGIKRKKEVEQSEAESNRVENLMASMRDALLKANCLLEQVASETKEQNEIDNDMQLLQHLQRGTPEYDEVLQSVVEKRRVRRRIEHQQQQAMEKEQERDGDGADHADGSSSMPPGTETNGERPEADSPHVDADAT